MFIGPSDDADLNHVLGIDEAGRGPLAGPVVAAGVILNPARPIIGLNDSKKLSEKTRELLYHQINRNALAVVVKEITSTIIDQINILQATLRAMGEVVAECLKLCRIDEILIDGIHIIPQLFGIRQQAIIQGDSKIQAIMAASIVAKVHRDRLMVSYDQQFPGYGFLQHKGYGTKAHMAAIECLGPSPIHRMSFAPLKDRSWLSS